MGIQGRRRRPACSSERRKAIRNEFREVTRDEMEFNLASHCKNSDILSEMESHWKAWAEECSAQNCIFKRLLVASSLMRESYYLV